MPEALSMELTAGGPVDGWVPTYCCNVAGDNQWYRSDDGKMSEEVLGEKRTAHGKNNTEAAVTIH